MQTASAFLPVLAALSVAGTALAQTPTNLIGLTRNIPIVRQEDPFACVNTARCFPPLPPTVGPFVGGTGYDAGNGGVWVSDGVSLALVQDTINNCNVLCGPLPVPTPSPNFLCTGLAVTESNSLLWVLDTGGNITQLRTTCPPTQVRLCRTGLLATATTSTTGLAVDDQRGLVFFSQVDTSTGQSRIHISTVANPCQIFQTTPVTPCPTGAAFGTVTGLAVDWCNGILWMTDGLNTQGWNYAYNPATPAVSFVPSVCCNSSTGNDPFVGLCVRPPKAQPFGASCANGACPPCPMVHGQVTDALVGNPNFVLDLQQAPAGSLAYLLVGAGPCTPGPVFPPLCGPVNIGGGTPVLVLGPVPTGGGVGCGGGAQWVLNVPMAASFCGTTWSSQAIVLCPSVGPISTSVSNCLTWNLTGS